MSKNLNEYSKEYLNEVFEYRDGELFYRKKTHRNMSDSLLLKPVGYLTPNGYKNVFLGRRFRAFHRYIFVMFHGYYPDHVDHINGNKSDNRIENLRAATPSQNSWNKRLVKNSKSGVKNVFWYKKSNKWAVKVGLVWVGYFKDLELAELVAIEYRNKFNGEFANHG